MDTLSKIKYNLVLNESKLAYGDSLVKPIATRNLDFKASESVSKKEAFDIFLAIFGRRGRIQ